MSRFTFLVILVCTLKNGYGKSFSRGDIDDCDISSIVQNCTYNAETNMTAFDQINKGFVDMNGAALINTEFEPENPIVVQTLSAKQLIYAKAFYRIFFMSIQLSSILSICTLLHNRA